MDKKKILKKLEQDEHYYGEYGRQFLSNSDISVLLKNPGLLREEKPKSTAMVIGGYFHTAILEPDKLKKFKIVYGLLLIELFIVDFIWNNQEAVDFKVLPISGIFAA